MAFDTEAVATKLVTMLAAISGISAAQLGAPESVGPKLSAYVTAGSQSLNNKVTGIVRREARYFVSLAYRVDNSEATAETTLMDTLDLFLAAVHADKTLGGTCLEARIDTSLADTPEYVMRAGKEFREFPILVTAVQHDSYTVNP